MLCRTTLRGEGRTARNIFVSPVPLSPGVNLCLPVRSADPVDGALLVFRVADRAGVEAFAKQDPYVVNGLVVHWQIRPWTVVIGGE